MSILTQLTTVLFVVVLSSSSVVKSPTSDNGTFELLILHNNDMHARFEQTSQVSGVCTTEDRELGKCYGGFPRVAHVVKEARRAALSGEGPPVLYLNAGDTYTGTAWFTIYKWKIAAEFINALQPDAVSLGNHEFDEAVDGVIPFIRNLSSPVLAANLILDNVLELKNEPNLHKSIVLIKNGVDIGIIGYLTPETKFLAPINKVEYEDEVVALRREVNKLKNQGVNIIIALGHSGYIRDLEIAREVEHLDLVIGGHSNTFLWNSNTTSQTPEVPQDSYPSIVVQRSGRIVRVVQAYAYTKYMGQLHLTFDSEGEIIASDGDPILLNQKIPKDPELLEMVEKYRKNVDLINSEIIGKSLITLNGDTICRLVECNIGNLITTAMLNYTKENFNDRYPNVNIAIVQGGRIRASIDRPIKPFDMTRGDWTTVLPYSDPLAILTMNGSVLKESLEHSVSLWRKVDSVGQFLQFTGMQVIFDLSKPPGSRIVETKAVCSNCGNKPREIKDHYEYKIIMPEFLANAGDGYTMFKDIPRETLNYNELECVLEYIKKYSPIGSDITGRIKILNESTVKSSPLIHSTDQNSAAIRFEVNQVLNLMFIFSICRYI